MATSLKNRLAIVVLCLLAASAAFGQNIAPELNITLGEQRVKFAPTRSFQEMRLEVVNSVGEVVFTHTTTEAEFDWNLRAANREALAPGLYRYALTLKFGEDQSRQHAGHFIVEKGQDQIWLTASDGSEVSGTTLNAARSGGRSIAGIGRAEDKSVKRDVSGRELVDEKGNKLPDSKDEKKAVKAEKAALLGTPNIVAKFGPGGLADTDSAIIETGGNVGIGTLLPNAKLSVNANSGTPPLAPGIIGYFANVNESNTLITADSYGNGPWHSDFLFRRARGTMAAPLAIQADDIVGQIQMRGYGQTGFATTSRAGIRMTAAQNWSDTAQGAYLAFMTNPNNSAAINVERMRITDAGNVGIGNPTPGAKLDVAGTINTTTQYNVGGARILSNLGEGNLFAGVGAGTSNTTGYGNTFNGFQAGLFNTTAVQNTFTGAQAGLFNTGGATNTFTGASAGYSNTMGSANTFSGRNAGEGNTTGGQNVFIGSQAGDSNTTGNNNTTLGWGSDVGSGALDHATAIGADAVVATSNSIVLGRSNGQDKVGIGTNAPGNLLTVNGKASFGGITANVGAEPIELQGNGAGISYFDRTSGNANRWVTYANGTSFHFFTGAGDVANLNLVGTLALNGCIAASNISCASDARLKEQVTGLRYGLRQLMQLRPVSWQWKDRATNQLPMGLIAQEVEPVMPELVLHSTTASGTLGLNYMGLLPVMVKATQEQQAQIQQLLQANQQQQTQIQQLMQANHQLRQRLHQVERKVKTRQR